MSTATVLKKILVIDDDHVITSMLEGLLSAQGYQVFLAFDGLDAMLQVKKIIPDLVILDILMPELNGFDVCSNVKFDQKLKHIPIIMLTSREQELDPRIGKLMGIDYMHKPLDTKILLERIQNLLK